MADIRINALATTATTPASDDYLALDGTAQGTRKILATNIANNVTDVILGASGPSVKSSLSARAPRQGLVFNGTAGATVSGVAAFGSSDFSVAAWINQTSAANAQIVGANSNGFVFYLRSTGKMLVLKQDTGGTSDSTGSVTAGKTTLVVYTKSGTTGTFYFNGVAGGTVTDNFDYTVAFSTVGKNGSGAEILNGLCIPFAYNRALSAAEVVALYEAGAPSGADYNSASNTSVITGDNSTFASDTGYWTKVGSATIGSGIASIPNSSSNITRNGLFTKGKRYKIQFTISNVAGGGLYVFDGAIQATYTTNGTKTLEWTASGANLIIGASGSGDIDDLTLFPLGLLLAPDAAQAGGGLTWYDTSGNAANITLPASGVSWNVPTSGYVTSGSSLNLSAGGTNQNITLTPSGTGAAVISKSEANTNAITTALNYLKIQNTSSAGTYIGALEFYTWDNRRAAGIFANRNSVDGTSGILSFAYSTSGNSFAEGFRLNSTGNFLIGTTTDGGQKLQVSGATTVAGGIWSTSYTNLPNDSTSRAILGVTGGVAYLQSLTGLTNNALSIDGSSITFRSGSYTTALTLDSSQNATFAGTDVTVNGGSTSSNLTLKRASNSFGAVVNYNTTTTNKWFHGLRGLTNDNWYLYNNVAGNNALIFDAATSDATFAGKTYTAAGTAAAPAISFSGDTDSGLYSAAGNQVSLACGGAQIWNTTVNGISMALGKDIYLGNAYQAGAPTATGYLTIKDSNGNAYKIPVVAV